MKIVTVEFFHAGGCVHCANARGALRETAMSIGSVRWEEVNVADNPSRAVDLGVIGTPAVAVDGRLVFETAPSAAQLRTAIEARLREA